MIRKRHRILVRCCDCPRRVWKSAKGSSPRCPACQIEYIRARNRERGRRAMELKAERAHARQAEYERDATGGPPPSIFERERIILQWMRAG